MIDWVLDTSWHKEVFSFGQNSESNYIEWRLSRGALKESCFGNLILSQNMFEISYHNKDKINAKCLKRSHFKNVETKTKKSFLRNFWEKRF